MTAPMEITLSRLGGSASPVTVVASVTNTTAEPRTLYTLIASGTGFTTPGPSFIAPGTADSYPVIPAGETVSYAFSVAVPPPFADVDHPGDVLPQVITVDVVGRFLEGADPGASASLTFNVSPYPKAVISSTAVDMFTRGVRAEEALRAQYTVEGAAELDWAANIANTVLIPLLNVVADTGTTTYDIIPDVMPGDVMSLARWQALYVQFANAGFGSKYDSNSTLTVNW